MGAILKRKQVRVYLDQNAENHLAKLSDRVKSLSESAIVTELLWAALEACAERGYRLHLPLIFEVVDEPQPSTKTRK
jgi:hypothetical protein